MEATHTRSTRWWHADGPEHFTCELCPRTCRLRPGQRGFCFVREATAEGMVLSTWGRSSGFCIDPIEKKPLYHYFPGTPILSFGTAGCNLGCSFCQNWDLSRARELDRLQESATAEQIAETARRSGCASVAYTYNEPIVFAEYAMETAAACHQRGVRNVAVTAGYISPAARVDFFRDMDAANVDLKAFTDGFYRDRCQGRLQPVLDTLTWLVKETAVWVEITTLLIPGLNDSDEEIDAMTRWVHRELGEGVPHHFSAFHPAWRLMDRPRTDARILSRARDIARKNGLQHVYTGNVRDPEGGSTWCPGCGTLLIGRDGYAIRRWNVHEGACPSCGRALSGHFDSAPGTWGSRREPVRAGP